MRETSISGRHRSYCLWISSLRSNTSLKISPGFKCPVRLLTSTNAGENVETEEMREGQSYLILLQRSLCEWSELTRARDSLGRDVERRLEG